MRLPHKRFTVWRLMVAIAVAAFTFAVIVRAARSESLGDAFPLFGGFAVAILAVLACYRLALPAIWLIAALVSWDHPGDEYGLFFASCLPVAWLALLLEFGHIREVLPILLSAGLAMMALVGWLMDGLRVRRSLWLPLLVLGAIALVLFGLSEYPSYQRAIARNGSLTAYISAATNLSLYLASTLAIVAALLGRVVSYARHSIAVRRGRSAG